MATILRIGQVVNGYTIQGEPYRGGMAISYPALSKKGEKVFFKQYKSPSVTVPWYKAYVAYQAEIKRRIEKSDAVRFCYRFIDFFEAKAGAVCYFQVFEFIENGGSLEKILAQFHAGSSPLTWEQRLIFARVMLAGVSKLHAAKVIHTDLKPANIQMIRDESIRAGFTLKVIDMDFSILEDKRAPWHGHDMGYVGSPNYMSPEHLKSPPPGPASDVFTCGLMLYELLAQGHPYASEEPEEYQRKVFAGKAPTPVFAGPVTDNAALGREMMRSLSPDPKNRPTAIEMLKVLQGTGKSEGSTATGSTELRLVDGEGKSLSVGIRTEVGRSMLNRFGADAQFADTVQFTLERDEKGWVVLPAPSTANETLHNGKAITSCTALSEGDRLAVGRESKGVAKLPMTVRLF